MDEDFSNAVPIIWRMNGPKCTKNERSVCRERGVNKTGQRIAGLGTVAWRTDAERGLRFEQGRTSTCV